jgi:hypothetical protein
LARSSIWPAFSLLVEISFEKRMAPIPVNQGTSSVR